MLQDHYIINIAKRDVEMFDNKPSYFHYCYIKKSCADFRNMAELISFVNQIRRAFAEIGEFKITVACWKFHGENLDI